MIYTSAYLSVLVFVFVCIPFAFAFSYGFFSQVRTIVHMIVSDVPNRLCAIMLIHGGWLEHVNFITFK